MYDSFFFSMIHNKNNEKSNLNMNQNLLREKTIFKKNKLYSYFSMNHTFQV